MKLIVPVKDFIPYSWKSLASLKSEYYIAISHRYCGNALLQINVEDMHSKQLSLLKSVHRITDDKVQLDIQVPKNEDEKFLLGTYNFYLK